MNPSGTFGSSQGGAFQAPGGTMKTSLFGQPFGQQNPSSQGLFQPPAFGQQPQPVMNQSAGHGNPIFGQTPVFGQSQPLSTMSPAPAFGQQPLGTFGNSNAPSFGQNSVLNQGSVLGPGAGFGQPPAFGVTSAFGSNPTLGQPQPLFFGQTSFGQTSSTSSSTSVFGQTPNITQSRGFGSSEFSFKPANDAIFKPIFSASPEPTNPQITPVSGSSFCAAGSQVSSSTNAGFSFLTGSKAGPAGFSLSQPAPVSSSSSQNNSLTTACGDQTKTLPFSFSQPAVPPISSTTASIKEPTTPSSFSFSLKNFQTQPTPLSVGAGFDQLSAFGEPKSKVETSLDKNESNLSDQGNSNIFREFSKGTKRKDPAMPVLGIQKPATDQDAAPSRAESPRQPSKRPLIRSRGQPGGLLSRALNAIRKDQSSSVRNEGPKENPQQAATWEETERKAAQPQEDELPAASSVQTPTRDMSTPASHGERSESLDSLSGMSPSELTCIMCRNIPQELNKRNKIEKHFARFGKVCKVLCRPAKNLAIVYFNDHVTAAKAKKRGKVFDKHELLILWMKKKHSKYNHFFNKFLSFLKSLFTFNTKCAGGIKKKSRGNHFFFTGVFSSFSSPVRRASPAKVLQFDADPQKEIKTESLSSERPMPSSLLPLIGQVAETAEEKFRLLEQRDKILRQGRSKRTDLDLAFVGTCPDMCPEKERYMRETRNQLSVFEVIPNTEMVNHTAAIKEYSRSSADQEEPLPHELRPLPVLKMTMDYLVTQIMDLSQDNYRDWYDFVWNRTRSIRKDITQQRLCCPQTVSLIEKCTRFHVHCAHHLCEEHMSSFDPKINTENMTKCLQSLKEMYEDLATHQTFCPSEAEFRQYSVLLKLNDGDILRSVQQFRDEVRNSPELKFAVQAFAAVNSNNFVRFFKLVKGASYLAGCLLHRYFNQVRAKALKVLNMALTVGPRSTPLPVEDVARMLMFPNSAEATDYVQQFALNVTDGMVELSRVVYQEPDIPPSPKRSAVIIAKKTVLNGEVVNGGPLPIPPHHTPQCSFDLQNKYPSFPPSVSSETGETVGSHSPPAQLTEPQQLFSFISQPEPVKPPSPPPEPQPVYSDEEIMAELDCVIEEVVKAEVKEVTDEGAAYIAAALQESNVQVESMVSEVVQRLLREISSSEIKLEQERVAEEKRRLEEARLHEAFLAQFSSSLCTEIIHEVLDETIQETVSSEIQEAVNEKAERLAKCTEQICNSLVEETLNTDIAMLVDDLLEAELQRIYKYIKRWRDVVAVRRQLKRQMRGFPAAPCCVDPCFKLKALAPSAPTQPSLADLARGMVNLGNAGLLTLSSTRLLEMRQEVTHQMRVHYYFQQLLEKHVWAPLDLVSLVTENIPIAHDRIFWKALLLLPSDQESAASMANRVLSDWLEAKLGGEQQSEEHLDGSLWTLCVTNALQESGRRTQKVHIAVKASRGPLTENNLSRVERCSELQGTGALILLVPALPVFEPGLQDQGVPDSLLSALLQLKQLQQVNTWHCPLPLVVLVPGPDGALRLHTLMTEGLISEFTFVFIPETSNDLQGSKQVPLHCHTNVTHACGLIASVTCITSYKFMSYVVAIKNVCEFGEMNKFRTGETAWRRMNHSGCEIQCADKKKYAKLYYMKSAKPSHHKRKIALK
uniref:Germinal-center associated nuclear protein n=1 Tax=Oryzias sinensis TaxID=183150 RepID=A0A8C7Y5D3_9TELE